jgi:amino acid transporter
MREWITSITASISEAKNWLGMALGNVIAWTGAAFSSVNINTTLSVAATVAGLITAVACGISQWRKSRHERRAAELDESTAEMHNIRERIAMCDECIDAGGAVTNCPVKHPPPNCPNRK